MDFNGVQTVQGPNESFRANCSKGFKRFQMMNKSLIKKNDRSFKKNKKQSLSFISSNGRLALFCDARS